jgi:N-acetylglutamate synthase-like GNAT family acetyltransferase
MKDNITIQSVLIDSQEYDQTLKLRQKYLREPLGLVFTPKELEQDRSAHHLIARHEDRIIGCVLGIPEERSGKIRQMLVIPEHRNKGIGSLLLNKIEEVCHNLGVNHFYLHARQESLNFYLKNGYTKFGNLFSELGITHQRADKFY